MLTEGSRSETSVIHKEKLTLTRDRRKPTLNYSDYLSGGRFIRLQEQVPYCPQWRGAACSESDMAMTTMGGRAHECQQSYCKVYSSTTAVHL